MKNLILSALIAVFAITFSYRDELFTPVEAEAGYCGGRGCGSDSSFCGEYHCVVLSIDNWCLIGRNCTGQKGPKQIEPV